MIPNASATTPKADESLEARVKLDLEKSGVAVIPNLLDGGHVERLRSRLVEQAAGEVASGLASSNKSPSRTGKPVQYIWNLISKGECFRELVCNERVLELARHVLGPHITLYGCAGNAVGPGAPGGVYHRDAAFMPADAPWPVELNVLYMLDDFTEENGATMVVPGSHLRLASEMTSESFQHEAVSITGAAGSAVLFDNRVWHAIGANRTPDVTRHAFLTLYCVAWLRPQTNWTMITAPALYESTTPQLRELLGYHIYRALGSGANIYGTGVDRDAAKRASEAGVTAYDDYDWGWLEPDSFVWGELDSSGEPK